MSKLINRKLKIDIHQNSVLIENISDIVIENCIIEIQNILYGKVLYEKFDIQSNEKLNFNLYSDNFINEWINNTLNVNIYSNHRLIYSKKHNDKSKCFVILSNKKFEKLAEQLIIGLDKYTDIDILHYNIGYQSNLNYTNLKNIPFNINGSVDDAHYMQFSKAPVFLDVLDLGYENAIFLDADIQVKSNINNIVNYINEIEDGPIFQKGAHDYTIVRNEYIPGPLVQNLLNLPKQKYPHGITNIVIFNKKHKSLFKEWEEICFSDEIKEIKEKEFLHDELLLNCLMWKLDIKPKYFWLVLNIKDIDDVKFFYNYSNIEGNLNLNLNNYDKGHPYQSFIPYNKEEILLFHCIKDIEEAKIINEYIYSKEVKCSFRDDIINFYNNIEINPIRQKESKPKINVNFINGAFVEVKSNEESNYLITLKDNKNDKIIHQQNIGSNMWTKTNIEYFVDYNVTIESNNEIIYEYNLDLNNKNVYISIESSSLGDSLAWIPYVEEFRKKHNCNVFVSTFLNDVLSKKYEKLKFVQPGTPINDIFAMYKIGWYYNDINNNFNSNKNKIEFKNQPLQKTASDILGLEYEEIIPLIDLPKKKIEKKVGIAIHGTTQAKYWNNEKGWQEVVNYLNNLGYEVMLYSKENDNYMGNRHPHGITKFSGGNIQDVINDLVTCEFFIGIGSGLSWLAWSCNLPIILISGFSEEYTETKKNTHRIINNNVCNGCFNKHRLDASNWNWCPENKEFECSKMITSNMVINEIDKLIKK